MIQIEHFASVLSPLSCGHTRNLPRIKKTKKTTQNLVTQSTCMMSSTCFYYVVVLFGGFAFSFNLAFYTFFASVTKICVFVHCKYFLDMSCMNYVTNIFSKTNMIYCGAITVLCPSFGRPHLEETRPVLFQGHRVVVPLVLRRRIGLCSALQRQTLAL